MITSSQNAKIKQVRALQTRAKARREAGLFVVEGVRLAEEAFKAGWQPNLVLFTEELNERGQEVISEFRNLNIEIEQVATHVLQAASDTQSAQGILLTLPILEAELPKKLDFVLIADQVRDPGNLGTLMRSAAAAGVQAVFLTPGCADAFSPKVVRAGMGAHFQVPVRTSTWDKIEQQCQAHGLTIYLAEAGEGIEYSRADLRAELAFIVGGEAQGASQEARNLENTQIFIPMPGGSESLNAAMAVSILMFEVVRQRRQAAK